ncbi:glycogen synthase kinase binding protein [Amia ocellicauda]|uniref:glycogen synthase kinase binding protein n=1 Tax=Amia ocellicauda TaxID=2972642 RepID=UPI0034647159
MPCRKENYILLEQSVTVDSKEVDALVTKIGEALQLHNNTTGAHQKTASCLHHSNNNNNTRLGSAKQPGNHNHNRGSALYRRAGCCIRLRNRSVRSRASPYCVPGESDQEWDSLRAWNRKKIDVSSQQDDPHQLLQELILSGNLIKEAVRRLQLSAAERVDHPKSADNLQC